MHFLDYETSYFGLSTTMENILKSPVFESVFYIVVMPIVMDFVLWKRKKIRYRKHLQILISVEHGVKQRLFCKEYNN